MIRLLCSFEEWRTHCLRALLYSHCFQGIWNCSESFSSWRGVWSGSRAMICTGAVGYQVVAEALRVAEELIRTMRPSAQQKLPDCMRVLHPSFDFCGRFWRHNWAHRWSFGSTVALLCFSLSQHVLAGNTTPKLPTLVILLLFMITFSQLLNPSATQPLMHQYQPGAEMTDARRIMPDALLENNLQSHTVKDSHSSTALSPS